MVTLIRVQILFALALILSLPETAFSNAGITYHGRLLNANRRPVVAPAVHFRIQIRTASPSRCLMYEEIQTKDMRGSEGMFSLRINSDTPTSVNTEPFTLDQIFRNSGTVSFPAGKCAGSTSTVIFNTTDAREIHVAFNDGTFTGWEPLPPQEINYVPTAFEAVTLVGHQPEHFFRVVDAGGDKVSLTPWTEARYNKLLSVLDASSVSGGVTNINGTSSGFTGTLSGDVTGTQGATSVQRIQGYPVFAGAPMEGDVLTWVQALSRWEPRQNPLGDVMSTRTLTAGTGLLGGGDLSADRTFSVNVGTGPGQIPQLDGSGRLQGSVLPTSAIIVGASAGGDLTGTYPNPAIAANAITSTKINDGAVTPSKLSSGSANGQVMRYDGTAWTTAKLSYTDLINNGSGSGSPWPTTTCLAGETIIWSSIADAFVCQTLSISSSNIGAGAVGTTQLADGAVTNQKIASVSVDKITSGSGLYLTYQPDGVPCAAGQILKWNSGRWTCSDDDEGVITEADPTVSAYAKNAPSADFSTPANVLTLNTVPVAKGGTGATTATAAINNLLPSQATHSGKVLQTNGTNVSWVAPTNGTVTSVTGTAPISVATGTTTPVISLASGSATGQVLRWSGAAWTSSTDGSALTALNATNLTSGTLPTARLPAMTGDVTSTAGSNTLTIANGSVTNAKVVSITANKITSGAGLYLTYQPNGAACAAGQVLKWNNSRWECGTDTGLTAETDPSVSAFAKNSPSSDFTTPGNVLTLNTVPVAKGGTGATTATAAITNLLPSQATHSGKFLQTNGTAVSWATVPQGTVTSVTASAPLSVANGTTTPMISMANGTVTGQMLRWSGTAWTASTVGTALTALNATNLTTGTLPAARLPAFNGDVTSTAGSSTLTIANGSVTNAKVVSITANKVSSGAGIYMTYQPNGTACAVGQVLKWNSSRWECGADAGIAAETDPKVGANTTNALSKWNGSALVASAISETGGNASMAGSLTTAGTVNANGGLVIDGNTVIDDGGGWHRSYGQTGWYNQTYGGGIWMSDVSYVRVYGGKIFYADNYIQSGTAMYAPAYYYTSDRRLKTDISSYDNALDKVLNLRGVNFRWKKNQEEDIGFIAQEVEAVEPRLVTTENAGKEDEKKSVKYGNIVALVVEAIKELWDRLETTDEKVELLQAENQELKNRLDQMAAQLELLQQNQNALGQRLPASEGR